ncbi:unnamed protein product [Medioppia subpectinata]|uniref:Uncharacterized protein n=1 Tax=Medioppia subpectinata TaxID=1979941 RepID=A0A7R9QF02_9ACAR|nr:unnamed protein product [Medioppia subpectinata]CAG2118880.1 unnamed protein product [Medioppia subpectinata]
MHTLSAPQLQLQNDQVHDLTVRDYYRVTRQPPPKYDDIIIKQDTPSLSLASMPRWPTTPLASMLSKPNGKPNCHYWRDTDAQHYPCRHRWPGMKRRARMQIIAMTLQYYIFKCNNVRIIKYSHQSSSKFCFHILRALVIVLLIVIGISILVVPSIGIVAT